MCKNKVNDVEKPELKTEKLSGGMLRPTYLAIITENAARARMPRFDYLVQCAMYLHENQVVIEKDECRSDNDNRQTFIRKKVAEYVAQEAEYRQVQALEMKLYDELKTLTVDYNDPFHSSNMCGRIDELHYNLSAARAALRDFNVSGAGLLKDISKLLSNKLVWPLEAAGDDTCFTLMCPQGTVTIPLKIVDGELWMGSLPSKSVVYLNGRKVAI